MKAIRDAIGRINFMANKENEVRDLRRGVLQTVATARKVRGGLAGMIRGMSALQAEMEAEISAWIDPHDITSGRSGPFDVCDLRCWLAIADRAGVNAVPAREIMSMTDDELDSVLSKIPMPATMSRNLAKHISAALESDPALRTEVEEAGRDRELAFDADTRRRRSPAELIDKAYDAMEEVPASWMVRTNLCGSSNLKSLVGTGLMLKGDDTANLAPDVEIGAGWAQVGNRRAIDFADARFVNQQAQGHKPVTHYLARPWAQPARFHDGEDLHRSGSPLAGPGKWPAEWRAYIQNGQVTGVANYYGWTGEGRTSENAWNAIETAAMAQRMVDTAMELGLSSGFANEFMMRRAARLRDDVAEAMADLDEGGLHATLDFIETADGLKFLEGGPGHNAALGGHPTAFAGQGIDPGDQSAHPVSRCVGVAYKIMPHVHLAEPETWVDGEPEGCIDDWAAARELAIEHAPLSEGARSFLEKVAPDEEALEL